MEWEITTSYNKWDYLYKTDNILDHNQVIWDCFEELTVINEYIKDINTEIKEKFNEEERLMVLLSEIDMLKSKLKPLTIELKALKEEFQVKNNNLFANKKTQEKKKNHILTKITASMMKKQEMQDDAPIIVNINGKPKKLVVKLKPQIKKENII